MRKDLLLIRHGDGKAMNRNIAHAGEQVFQRFHVQARRNTPLTFSRRSAAFMMAGESECETGSPTTP